MDLRSNEHRPLIKFCTGPNASLDIGFVENTVYEILSKLLHTGSSLIYDIPYFIYTIKYRT